MGGYLLLPLVFLKFWYSEAPRGLLAYFASLNGACLHLLSLPSFLRTFFKPLKNEYRQGLVGFSIGMGMFIKTIFILVDLLVVCFLLVIELLVFITFLMVPPFTVLLMIT